MRTGPALLALVLLACAPTLGGDGFYRCTRGGRCPSSAPFCGADGLCHTQGLDAGTDAASDVSVDARPTAPPLSFRDCRTSAECDAEEECFVETDSITHAVGGYCTRPCVGELGCPEHEGAASACRERMPRECLRPCTTGADCPAPMFCTYGRWGGSVRGGVCATFDDAIPLRYYEPCSDDLGCTRPLACVAGRCMRPCPDGDECLAAFEICAAGPGGVRTCLVGCAGDPSACDLVTGATCEGTPLLCRPPGW